MGVIPVDPGGGGRELVREARTGGDHGRRDAGHAVDPVGYRNAVPVDRRRSWQSFDERHADGIGLGQRSTGPGTVPLQARADIVTFGATSL